MKEGWDIRKLGQVFRTSSGGTPSKTHREYYDGGHIKWLRSGEVSQGQILDTEIHITEEGVKNSSAKLFPVDTVVIAMYGATVGQVGILKAEMTTNQAICGIFPNPSVHPSFLSYFLKSHKSKFLELASGAAQPNISQQIIKNTLVPVPPISEQDKIVAELDGLTGIVEKKKRQLEELDKLAQSIFYDMFGDPIANERGWDKKKIGSFSSCIAGATPSTSHDEYWDNGTIPWLSSGEVGKGRIYDTEKKITQAGFDCCSTRLVPAHTLVIAMAGQGKTRGTAGVAEIPLCTNQSICSVIPNEKVALVDFLYYQMRQMYKDLRSISNGDGGRGGLNLKLIGNYPVIVPPHSLQTEFAQKVQAIEKQKELVKLSIVETETLFDSRMDFWFNN